MSGNEFKNTQNEKSTDNETSSRFYFETEVGSMDAYKRRRDMASKYGGRKEYKTNQRLDGSTWESKGPPDGFIFDR